VLYYALGLLTIDGFYASNVQSKLSLNIIQPFRDFFNISFGKVFTEGFNFSEYIAANGVGSFAATFIASMLAFCMVDMFDTLGTLYGACSAGNLLDKDGNKLKPKEISGNYDTVSVSMPVLMNKELPLKVSLVGGAGATEENCVVDIEPKSIQVAGDTTVLQTLNQLVVATVDLSSFATSYETTVTIPLDNNLRNLSGVTEATVRISVRGLETEKITATNITTTGTNRHVEIATTSLVVTVRAPAETISQITADNIRVVADLTNYKATSGTVAVPAKVYVDGFSDAGAIGEYVVNVHFTGG